MRKGLRVNLRGRTNAPGQATEGSMESFNVFMKGKRPFFVHQPRDANGPDYIHENNWKRGMGLATKMAEGGL